MLNRPYRAVFNATFTETLKFNASFAESLGLSAQFGEVYEVLPDPYTGDLIITPKAYDAQTLECAHKTMPGDVVVLKVPYYETHNNNGLTVYIASEV